MKNYWHKSQLQLDRMHLEHSMNVIFAAGHFLLLDAHRVTYLPTCALEVKGKVMRLFSCRVDHCDDGSYFVGMSYVA